MSVDPILPARAVLSVEGVSVLSPGRALPVLVQQAATGSRPYLHPVYEPNGTGVLTEDKPPHHPWQHGISIGLNDVNGVGFWTESLLAGHVDGKISVDHVELLEPEGEPRWRVTSRYHDPAGDILLNETQVWSVRLHSDHCVLDLWWTLTAQTDVAFGKYPYGGLFVRMPYRSDYGASALTSDGALQTDGEGKPARWVAVGMHIGDSNHAAGIAIFDHPNSAGHPLHWRIDNQFGFGPAPSIPGAWNLGRQETIGFRHRVLAFRGVPSTEMLESQWRDYVHD